MNKKKLSKLKIKGVQHYAEVAYPGVIVPETRVQKVIERTPSQIKFSKMPSGEPYAFRFFDQGYVKKQVDGKFVKVPSRKINKSKITFIGETRTPEQVAAECGEDSLTYWNAIKCNNYAGAVKTLNGGYIGLDAGEDVIDPSQVKYVEQENEREM